VVAVKMKDALTELFSFIMIEQFEASPLQLPVQPSKDEPERDAADNVTDVPAVYVAEQVDGQLILPSALLTVPEPLPDSTNDRV